MKQLKKAETIYLIKRLNNLVNHHIDELLKEYGMARSQFQVLYLISESGSLNQKNLLEHMQIEPATLTGLLDTLEAKRYIRRSLIIKDKRSNIVQLTKSGRDILRRIPHPGVYVQTVMFNSVSEADRKAFYKIVSHIINNLEHSNGQKIKK
ncbi:MarR family transcriptional regulator [Patescibacteria group bacterium]|jgi:DNA-binding MarR family transcriptional regulator|nr:MarR family transcriptional regulator [Patescibacteria group bacterium]